MASIGLGLGFLVLRCLNNVPKPTRGSFLFQCLANNYVFLPLPLVMMKWGSHGVALLLFSSAGYEIIIWSIGALLFVKHPSWQAQIKQMFGPAFTTLALTFLFVVARDLLHFEMHRHGWGYALLEVFVYGAEMLGQALIAIAVLVAGSRLAVLRPKSMMDHRIWLVAAIRLIVVPAIMLSLLAVLPFDLTAKGILQITAVMTCAVISVIFSERFGGDTDFTAGSLLLTHLCALVTMPLLLSGVL